MSLSVPGMLAGLCGTTNPLRNVGFAVKFGPAMPFQLVTKSPGAQVARSDGCPSISPHNVSRRFLTLVGSYHAMFASVSTAKLRGLVLAEPIIANASSTISVLLW